MHPPHLAMPESVFRRWGADDTPTTMACTCHLCALRPATIHLTELAPEGTRHELHICAQCMREHGLDLTSPPPLAALTPPPIPSAVTGAVVVAGTCVCPSCGLSFTDYQQSNILGCSACIEAFDRPFMELVQAHHGNKRHTGRVPTDTAGLAVAPRPRRPSRATIEKRLKAALVAEDFETAARLRDQLHSTEAQS